MARAVGLVLAAFVLAQPPRDSIRSHPPTASATGVIRGRVVSAATGDPIVNAEVTIGGMGDGVRPDEAPESVLTDAAGRYEMPAVAGHLTVYAAKAGYVPVSFGMRRAGDPPRSVTVSNGTTVEGIDIAMQKAAAISGRIVDEFGDPVVGGEITVIRLARIDGRMRMQGSRRTATDDLGEYRVGGLDSGGYLVALGGGGGTATRWALTYYPGTISAANARAVSVQSGDEQAGIDFAASSAEKHAVHVSGRVVDASGRPSAATVYLAGGGERPAGTASGVQMRVGEAGTFTATVEPGDTAAVAVDRDNQVAMAAFTAIDADIAGLTLTLTRPGRIAGRVIFDEIGAPPASQVEIMARPAVAYTFTGNAGSQLGFAAVRPLTDGAFELKNLIGARDIYVRTVPRGWNVRSISVGARDLLDTPIEFKGGEDFSGVEVVLERGTTTLDGSAVDGRGQPVLDYEVIVVPEDRADRRAARRRWVRPDQSGRFSINGLSPGAYLVTAVDTVDGALWPDEEYVQRLRAGATRVVLASGDAQTETLRLVRQQ